MLPGSHRPGVIYPTRPHDSPEYDGAPEAFDYPDDPGAAMAVELEPGDVLFFDGYLLHSSKRNNAPAGTYRRALVHHYLSAESLLPWNLGGLIAAIGYALYAISHGAAAARRVLRVDPRAIAIVGLALAIFAGLVPAFSGEPLFTGKWLFLGDYEGGAGLPLSTVLLFDIGVYLVVLGSVLTLVLALEEEA